MEHRLKCGAAVGDITPLEEELDGLEALQRRRFGGILDPLHVRVLSLSDTGKRILIVCFELDKAPYPEQYMEELSSIFDVGRDDIIFTAVHAHAVPVTGDRIHDGPNNIEGKPENIKVGTHRYEARIHDIIMDTVRKAIEEEVPATLRVGHGESYINVDRRCRYHYRDERGVWHDLIALGQNREESVNRDLTVLRFDGEGGKPIAFLINYPVHCTVMHGNSAVNGKVGITSDIAGKVSHGIEEKFPGTVCMWTSAAAGNINPAMQCELTWPDPETGKPKQIMLPGDTTGLLDDLSMVHLADAEKTILAEMETIGDDISIDSRVKECRTEGNYHPYIVRLHMMRLGSVAILTVSGELYSSYELALKAVLPADRLIVMNHDCSNAYDCGYIPDAESLLAGQCWLPGVNDHPNIIPEKFKVQFISDCLEMYQSLFG